MATNQTQTQKLETDLKTLRDELSVCRSSNLRVKDDMAELKGHYTTLVTQLNQRLEHIEESFRSFKKHKH